MKKGHLCWLSTCMCIAFFGSALCQERTSKARFSKWLFNDPVSLVKEVKGHQLLATGFIGLNIGILSTVDEGNSSYFQKEYKYANYLTFGNEFGTFRKVAPASAALFGVSLLTRNHKFQDAAFTSFQSVLNTAITVNAAKFIFARSRPYEEDGAHDFDFFHPGATSFPSGHASTSFALITPWVMYYPRPITYALFVIPVSTSIARIAKGKHWLTDVTAGALIGGYWGYYLSKKHLSIDRNNIQLAPFVQGEGGGFSLNVSLN